METQFGVFQASVEGSEKEMSEVEEVVDLSEEDILAAAVHAAWQAADYVTDSGEQDKAKLAEALYELIVVAVVTTRQERVAKALTRGALVTAMFPLLPGPEAWINEPDPDLAEKVYGKIRGQIWELLVPDLNGKVQRLIGERTSPRLVMCRTEIGADRIDAVYVTRNKECLKEDFFRPLSRAIERVSRKMENNTVMVIERVPEHGRAFAKVYDQTVKGVLETGNTALKLALASNNGDTVADDDNAGE